MFVNEEVEINLRISNKDTVEYYKNLGYNIDGDFVIVQTKDLKPNSRKRITFICDICGKTVNRRRDGYRMKEQGEKDYCNSCHLKYGQSGENAPRWNPNIADEERNSRHYPNPQLKEFIKKVMNRDGFTCQCCGTQDFHNMVVHHLDGYNWCKEKRYDETNGITLCKTCHKNFHLKYGYGDNTKEQFEEWIGEAIELVKFVGELPTARKVYCFELDKIYDSAEIASFYTECEEVCIRNCCKHLSSQTKNKHWFYYDEFEKMPFHKLFYYINCGKYYCQETSKFYKSQKEICKELNIAPSEWRIWYNDKSYEIKDRNGNVYHFVYIRKLNKNKKGD